MSITVEVTYEMSKALGAQRFDLDAASNVREVVDAARKRFRDTGADFERLTRVAAIAVNGVLVNHRKGVRTPVADGDTVTFVKAAAGG